MTGAEPERYEAPEIVEAVVSESHEQRIAREEAYWTGPRLFVLGLSFMAFAIAFIYFIASI